MKKKMMFKVIGMVIALFFGAIILSCNTQEFIEPISQENEMSLTLKCATCTLTPGYWMTHNASFKGGASKKADDTWELIGPLAENEVFFLSGQTYFEVLWTTPAGNAYYILAQHYIAAALNALAGADFQDAQDAFDAATVLFNTYIPAQTATLEGQDKSEWTNLATVLDDYNNGLIGPGHCPD